MKEIEELFDLPPTSLDIPDTGDDLTNNIPRFVPEQGDNVAAAPAGEVPDQVPDMSTPSRNKSSDDLPDEENADIHNVMGLFEKEAALWADHPCTTNPSSARLSHPIDVLCMDVDGTAIRQVSSLIGRARYAAETPVPDITKAFDPPRPSKDIGEADVQPPPSLPYRLASSEQKLLKQAKAVVGDRTASEF